MSKSMDERKRIYSR